MEDVVNLFESSILFDSIFSLLSFSISVDVNFGFKKFLNPEIKFWTAFDFLSDSWLVVEDMSVGLFISISFILSIFIGIGFSLGHHYFISLFCSGVQLISMIMFILTFIPGGRAGIDCIKRTLSSPFTKLFINKAKSDLNEL